jgi:Tfp pilus assembly PilM family ATPase
MFDFMKNKTYPIGIDVTDDGVRLSQMREKGGSLVLVAGRSEDRPEEIQTDSADWQRWAIDAVRKIISSGRFYGRDVVASMPPADVFIEHLKIQKGDNRPVEELVLAKAKQKLPQEFADAMIKYIPSEEDIYVVAATPKRIIERHIAIYENADLHISSIGIWPVALANCYARFFGRRQTDIQTVAMLIDIGQSYTNLVICRHRGVLFAKSIPLGKKHLEGTDAVGSLILELGACRKQFSGLYKKAQIQKLVFISGQTVDRETCGKIAQQLQIAAQVGDCMSAVEVARNGTLALERRNNHVSWAASFGLSLS